MRPTFRAYPAPAAACMSACIFSRNIPGAACRYPRRLLAPAQASCCVLPVCLLVGCASPHHACSQVSPEDSGSFTDFPLSDGEAEVLGQAAQEPQEAMDYLFGCEGCGFASSGCSACRQGSPVMERPCSLRWKPEEGHPQQVCACMA